jgi:hypothetical protein
MDSWICFAGLVDLFHWNKQAWLNGKIMVALLIEAFIAKASFSPDNQIECQPRYMA